MKTELKIEYLPISAITPYENNARKHNDFDVDVIAKSIEEFGMCDPIGVWGKSNIIVEGHGRLAALKKLGYTEVPVLRLDHLSDDQRKAYALTHNRSAELSIWDDEALMAELNALDSKFNFEDLGFGEFLLDTEDDTEVQEDDFDPVVPEEAITQPGDIYVLGHHRLMCGDSTSRENLVKLLDGRDVDLFYTDPPYNVNVSNSEGMTIANDDLANDSFRELLMKAFANASDFIREGGVFYCWHGDSERVNFQQCLEANGLIVKQCLIWVKNGFNFGRQDYKWQHEPCLYGWREGEAHYFVPEYNHPTVIEDTLNLKQMKKEELIRLCEALLDPSIPGTVIHQDKPLKNDLHPTMKPIVLCGNMIRNSSRKGDCVLDLFGGSGSTLIACEQLGRECYMMELSPYYCDVIVRRFIKFVDSSDDCYLIRNGERLPLPNGFAA